MNKLPPLEDMPFLKSLCWQGQSASVVGLADGEILELYERNWHYRGVLADLGDIERAVLKQLAKHHASWIVNEI